MSTDPLLESDRVAPMHTDDCESWACNHRTVCGVGVLYGSRCREHPMPGSSGDVARSATPPAKPETCKACHGRKERLHGWAICSGPCQDCNGTGQITPPEKEGPS